MKVFNLPKDVKPAEPASWCQEVGWVEAKPAKDLLVGEKRVYNFGVIYSIKSVTTKGLWTVLEVVSPEGKVYTSRNRSTKLVPFEK